MSDPATSDRRFTDRSWRKGEAGAQETSADSLPDLSANVYTRTDEELSQLGEDLEIERVRRAERIKLTLAEPAQARIRVEAVMPLDDEL